MERHESVQAEAVSIRQSGVRSVSATDVEIRQGAAVQVQAGEVEITQGAVLLARGGEVELDQAAGGVLLAQRAEVKDSAVAFLVAREVHGEGNRAVMQRGKELGISGIRRHGTLPGPQQIADSHTRQGIRNMPSFHLASQNAPHESLPLNQPGSPVSQIPSEPDRYTFRRNCPRTASDKNPTCG